MKDGSRNLNKGIVKNVLKAIVILRMRGIEKIGSTVMFVLERYADQLKMNNGS